MLEIIGVQAVTLLPGRLPGHSASLQGEPQRLPEGKSPQPLSAQSVVSEDQVVLSGATTLPASPLPLKPNEPADTRLRLSDPIPRRRPVRRKPTGDRQSPPEEESPEESPVGGRVDLQL